MDHTESDIGQSLRVLVRIGFKSTHVVMEFVFLYPMQEENNEKKI